MCHARNTCTLRNVLVSDFDFELPEELIAQEAAPRGQSRLLIINRATGDCHHASVAELGSFFRAGDLLVVNNTRVFAARLLGHRVPSGGAVECLLVQEQQPGVWTALMHPGQKLKPGARVRFEGVAGAINGEVLDRHFHGRRTIRLEAEGGSLADLVDAIGHVPLPPYIKRADTLADRERYQTVFARSRGSIAAPTAGLHFTRELIDQLTTRGVEVAEVTLHVGYGTFKPVRVDSVEAHSVDPERYEISESTAAAINRAKSDGRRVIAVGTTTTRALEDSASQGEGGVTAGVRQASLFIYPGHRFRVIDGLFTNFHLPKSSLLMLVAAFAGRERVLAAYREAIERRYRFYSYGDAMLIV